jgi:hypothetical protein
MSVPAGLAMLPLARSRIELPTTNLNALTAMRCK